VRSLIELHYEAGEGHGTLLATLLPFMFHEQTFAREFLVLNCTQILNNLSTTQRNFLTLSSGQKRQERTSKIKALVCELVGCYDC
jgi:hypothetical protein